MIIMALFKILTSTIEIILTPIALMELPINLIDTMASITAYGSWIIGSDLLVIVIGSILLWSTIKITVGIVLFIYRLIPFI